MSVRRSLGWTYLSQVLTFSITFGSTIILARILQPRDFGIFAMVTALAAALNVLLNFQLVRLVVREATIDVPRLQSLFTVNVIIGTVYFFVLLSASLLTRHIIEWPDISNFLAVFCVFPFIGMMEFLPSALAVREGRFRLISGIAVVRALVLAATSVALALAGYGYMSFAWGVIITSLVTAICYNIACWRPDLWRWRTTGLKSIMHFGTQMIGIGGMKELSNRAGEMTLGSLQGLALLGLYSRAASLPLTLYNNIFGAANNVIFSRMSRELRESATIHHTYLRFVRLIFGLLWPALVGMAVISPSLIDLLYGPNWHAAALPLTCLLIAAVFNASVGMVTEIFILRDATARQVKIEGVRSGLGYAMFLGGALISLPAAALAKLAESMLAFLLYRRPVDELLGAPRGALSGIYREAAILTIVAVLPSVALMIWSRWSPDTPWIAIACSTALGGAMWLITLIARGHPIVSEARGFLRQMMLRKADPI